MRPQTPEEISSSGGVRAVPNSDARWASGQMSIPPDLAFCRALPKVELHAHLSGSVTPARLQEVWAQREVVEPGFGNGLEAPKVWFEGAARGQNIKTQATFFAHFNTYIYHLLSTLDSLSYATRAVLEDFANDGVVYLELRTTPRSLATITVTSAEESVRVILGEISRWNAADTGERMQARLILSIDRSKHSAVQAEEIIRLTLILRNEGLPVVGVDLSGDPHGPLPDYSPAFNLANTQDLPITLHFAELPTSDSELLQLLSYNPSRLGHVIHVPPDIRQIIIDRKIPVELLLTCNILAGMLPDQSADPGGHHFGWWYTQKGHGVSIGTDDVGVFGSWGSEECLLVSKHFGLGRRDLMDLVRRGVWGIFDGCQRERVEGKLKDFERRMQMS